MKGYEIAAATKILTSISIFVTYVFFRLTIFS